jgi:cephalosporin hydroxylase
MDLLSNICKQTGAFVYRDSDRVGMLNQHHEEFNWALEQVSKIQEKHNFLEIGFGCGGTFLCWARLFNKVISINLCERKFNSFLTVFPHYNNPNYLFLTGLSQSQEIIDKVKEFMPYLNGLFIDGGHSYEEVKADYENYRPLIKKGVVVFHDTFHNQDIPKFIQELRDKGHTIDVYSSTLNSRELMINPPGFAHYGVGIEFI